MTTADLNSRFVATIKEHEASEPGLKDVGVAAAVVCNDAVAFRGMHGWRERDRRLPVTAGTIFEIGSLTKAFTATTLVIAAERGDVDLDRPLNAARVLLPLPDPVVAREVSLADILSHRTGIAANDVLWYCGPTHADALLAATAHFDIVPWAFRRTFIYNNSMYGVLGHLFEQLVGKTWDEAVATTILEPLQMHATSCSAGTPSDDVALPYVGGGRVPFKDLTAVAAAGAMRSNIDDMVRWVRFNMLDSCAIGRAHHAHITVNLGDVNPLLLRGLEWVQQPAYGLGWLLGVWRGYRVICHPGFIDGFSTFIAILPDAKVGVVVLANGNLSAVAGHAAKALLEGVMGDDATAPSPHLTPRELGSAAGTYRNALYGSLVVTEDSGRVEIRYNGHRWPVRWTDDGPVALISVFGLDIPVLLTFEKAVQAAARPERVSMPLALDPRIAPQVFERVKG